MVHEQLPSPTLGEDADFSGLVLQPKIPGLSRIGKQGRGFVVDFLDLINATGGVEGFAGSIVSN